MSARQKVRAFGPGDEKVRMISETPAIALPPEPPRQATADDILQPSTCCVKIDPHCMRAAIFMRTAEGQEIEFPLSSERCIKIAYDLLLAASINMLPPGLQLAINALKGCVFARKSSSG